MPDNQLIAWRSISLGREQRALAAYLPTSLNLTGPSTRSVVVRAFAGFLFHCFLQLLRSFKGPWWQSGSKVQPVSSMLVPVLLPLELCHGVGGRAKWGHPLLWDWKAQMCKSGDFFFWFFHFHENLSDFFSFLALQRMGEGKTERESCWCV